VKLQISMAVLGILAMLAAPVLADDDDADYDNPDVITAAVAFQDPDDPANNAFAVSRGATAFAGGFTRSIVDDDVFGDVCHDVVWLLQEAEKTTRKEDTFKQKQKDNVLITFLVTICDNPDNEPECILGLSDETEVAGCSGSLKADISNSDVGKVKVKCKDGIDPAASDFALSPAMVTRVNQAFPDLSEKFEVKFKDKDGQVLDPSEIDGLIELFFNSNYDLPFCG
jgi:hypothetical protein